MKEAEKVVNEIINKANLPKGELFNIHGMCKDMTMICLREIKRRNIKL